VLVDRTFPTRGIPTYLPPDLDEANGWAQSTDPSNWRTDIHYPARLDEPPYEFNHGRHCGFGVAARAPAHKARG
jgi:hypothetical protein